MLHNAKLRNHFKFIVRLIYIYIYLCIYLTRSFDERLNQATENASKLKVKLENPKAKLRYPIHRIDALTFIDFKFYAFACLLS